MATWDSFLAAVDEVEAPEEVRAEVKTLLVAQGLATPAQATGLEPAPLVKLAVDKGSEDDCTCEALLVPACSSPKSSANRSHAQSMTRSIAIALLSTLSRRIIKHVL